MTAAALVADLRKRGVGLAVAGDRLHWRAPKGVMIDEMREALRRHKPQVLEFLTTHRQGDVPTEWREGVAKLTTMAPLPGLQPERWQVLVADARKFVEEWAAQAARLGWSTAEVFGCHRRAPAKRYDAAGLVAMLNGDRVVVMTVDAATTENACGVRLRHFRRLTGPACERGLLWEPGVPPDDGAIR